MADVRVAGEIGETRPTEQPLNDDGNTFQLEPYYTPEGGTFEPNYTPEGGPFGPHFTPEGGTYEPKFTPEGGTFEPKFTPEGGTFEPYFTPKGGTFEPYFTPEGGTFEPNYTPEGGPFGPNFTPEGGPFGPNFTPEGGTFEPNYTPEGGPFETTEMPFEGESGFPTDGDLTSQPTVSNILDKSSSTEKPVDIEDEDLFRGPIKCCDQAVCDFAIGPDSECVEQEGYIEECEQQSDSYVDIITRASPELAAPRLRGVCMCKPGYLLEDSGKCTQRSEYNCCTDLDCVLYVGVHGECGEREGGNPEACDGIIKDEIKREVRVRREVGLGEATSTTSVYDLPQGKCICKSGYALVFGDCISTDTTDGGTTLRNEGNEIDFGTTETGTSNSGVDVSAVGNVTPIGLKCYDFRCTGYNCTRSWGNSSQYCAAEPGSKCYVSKECEANGLTYIFGCEDPCSNHTIPGSRDCFTVTCTPRDDACNNETSLMHMYRCTSGSGWLLSDHSSFLLVLSVVLGQTI